MAETFLTYLISSHRLKHALPVWLIKVGKILGRRTRQSSVAVVLAVARLILDHRVVLALRRGEAGRAHAETAASEKKVNCSVTVVCHDFKGGEITWHTFVN